MLLFVKNCNNIGDFTVVNFWNLSACLQFNNCSITDIRIAASREKMWLGQTSYSIQKEREITDEIIALVLNSQEIISKISCMSKVENIDSM